MGLRCTVFGHDWGEPEMERDRERDGDEVVVTVREVRACDRCGADEVLGESMEVTAATPPGGADDGDDGAEQESDGQDGDDGEDHRDPEVDDAVILEGGDEGDRDREPGEWPDRPERDEENDPVEAEPWTEAPGEEDAADEAATGEETAVDGPAGAAATEADDGPDTVSADSTPAGDAAGADAGDATAAGADAGDATAAGDDAAGEDAGEDDGAELLDDGTASGPVGAGTGVDPGSVPSAEDVEEERSPDPEDVEYHCPDCGFRDDRDRPTRRAGDICPECRSSYLVERVRE